MALPGARIPALLPKCSRRCLHTPALPTARLVPARCSCRWREGDSGQEGTPVTSLLYPVCALLVLHLPFPAAPLPGLYHDSPALGGLLPQKVALGRGRGRAGLGKVGGSGGCGSSAPPSPRQLRARPGALPAGWQCYPASRARPRGPGKGGSNLSQMRVLSFPSLLCRWASCDVKSSEQSWPIFICASWSCGQV